MEVISTIGNQIYFGQAIAVGKAGKPFTIRSNKLKQLPLLSEKGFTSHVIELACRENTDRICVLALFHPHRGRVVSQLRVQESQVRGYGISMIGGPGRGQVFCRNVDQHLFPGSGHDIRERRYITP